MTISPEVAARLRWTVGERLRKARELTGLDRGAFAREIGISRNSVTKYEAADVPPKQIVLRAWAMRCGVPPEWLRTGTVPTAPDGGPAMSRCTEPLALILPIGRTNEPPIQRLPRAS